MSRMAAFVLAWSTDKAHLKSFPRRIDPGVTVVVATAGVVEMVDVEHGVTVVSWVLTDPPSSGAFTFIVCFAEGVEGVDGVFVGAGRGLE